jgi:hypothetical protein
VLADEAQAIGAARSVVAHEIAQLAAHKQAEAARLHGEATKHKTAAAACRARWQNSSCATLSILKLLTSDAGEPLRRGSSTSAPTPGVRTLGRALHVEPPLQQRCKATERRHRTVGRPYPEQ